MATSEALPKIVDAKPASSAKKSSGIRRFSTRSALRCRDRRSSGKKVPKLNLPELDGSDGESQTGWNAQLQQLKLDFALGNPNISQTERSHRRPKKDLTAISHHTKFLYRQPNSNGLFTGQSPFRMDNDNSHKYFMSGYQGVVPGYRFLVGASYPTLTHDALNGFTDEIRDRSLRMTKPLDKAAYLAQPAALDDTPSERQSRYIVYQKCSGITPNYKGHIPGHKFRFGRTFGEITKDPMNRGSMGYLTAR